MIKIILIANTDWYLYNFRFSLIQAIENKGIIPILVSPNGKYVKIFQKKGWQHLEWRVGRQSIAPWLEIPAINRLKEIYKLVQPDLVHHHTNKAVLYGTMAARNLHIPVVNSIPGTGYVFTSAALKARIIRPITEFMFLNFVRTYHNQQMIFENRSDMAHFIGKKFIPSDKTNLIPSVGVDLTKFNSDPQKPNGTPIFALIGRMLWAKGVGIFVDAAKILKKQNIPCRMVLIGLPDYDNPDYVPTEILQKWDEENIVEWWGWQDDMPATYQKINVLTLPTQYGEGVPTTLIEASASRRTLIASDWPGCREVINHEQTGLLVRPGDAADLAEKIIQLSTNYQMRLTLAENAFQFVIKKFSKEYVNNLTFKVYNQLVNLENSCFNN